MKLSFSFKSLAKALTLLSVVLASSLMAREGGGGHMPAAPHQLEGGQKANHNPVEQRAFERGAEEGMYLDGGAGGIDTVPPSSNYPYPDSQPGLNDLNNSSPDVNNPDPANAKDLNNSIPDINNPFDKD